ncbi:hypothetical protein [Streptomyces griseus]|uniref:hypothetical protein n=1 Tax=Streptomyces griseus TaxID=1911 RepID=UPI0033CC67B1
MAALTTFQVNNAGGAPTFVEAGASDTAEIGSGYNTVAIYRNGSGSSVTVTAVAPGNTDYGPPLPDNAVVIAAGDEGYVPLRKAYDPADGTGRATLTTSAQDEDLVVAVVRMG